MTAATADGPVWTHGGPYVLTVHGSPRPQGSKTPFAARRKVNGEWVYTGKVALAEGGSSAKGRAATKAWRAAMTQGFRDQWAGREPLTGPLALRVTFTLPRPRGHYRTGRYSHLLGDRAPKFPAVKPDGGKYQRAVEDSLTDAGVWSDDALVVFWHGAKVYPLEWAHGLSGLGVPDPTVFCGVPTADALTQPGVVVRVWHV